MPVALSARLLQASIDTLKAQQLLRGTVANSISPLFGCLQRIIRAAIADVTRGMQDVSAWAAPRAVQKVQECFDKISEHDESWWSTWLHSDEEKTELNVGRRVCRGPL